jgi:predicted transcriptional regulator
MQVDRRIIENSLVRKGFVQKNKDHRYFYHEYQSKRTGIFTYTSHGTSYKTYGNPLLKLMVKQLKLDTLSQLLDLFNCPISAQDYNSILGKKKLI